MSTIDQHPLAPENTVEPTSPLAFDAYRDIHKGVRAELFAVTECAGNTDAGNRQARAALVTHILELVDLLVDHADLDARLARIAERATSMTEPAAGEQRARVHNLYLDLASFTGAYLAHQEFEERIVMPALLGAVGVEGAVRIQRTIVGSIPPPTMAKALALMIPAMNVEDRVELLGGMQASAPPQVFEGIWGLVNSVLAPADADAVGRRIGLR